MERNLINDNDAFAEIWRTSQQRCAEDMSVWLRTYLEHRRQKLIDSNDVVRVDGNVGLPSPQRLAFQHAPAGGK
jgi:hypothetical protein